MSPSTSHDLQSSRCDGTTLSAVSLRDLPSVDELVRGDRRSARGRGRAGPCSSARARRSAPAPSRATCGAARARRWPRRAGRRCAASLNATGVIVHTNLGRAPLADGGARARARGAARLLEPRVRPRRRARAARARTTSPPLLRRLTGAEAALVVNNNAAAVLLALAALAEGREVLVSRGELIEIGDGFRIPDVLARSGARLVEVGTTNRTRAADYERAIGPETALLLRVHQSNFRVVGFTEQPRARRARRASRAATGCRSSTTSAPARSSTLERRADRRAAALAAGADLVCFSGDKLLGGPQAGIVVGRADLVERLRRHPLQRALRADKLTLAALEGTLALYLDRRAHARSRCCGCCASRPRPCARAPSASPSSTGGDGRGDGRARRRRRAAARRARRASPARSRRSWPRRCARGEPPVSASSATGARCSTAARSPTPRSTRSRRGGARMPLTVGTAGPHRPRQDVARPGADRQGHRPAARGAGARDLDRPRLRAARAARRAPALARRRARATSASSATWSPARPGSTSSCS